MQYRKFGRHDHMVSALGFGCMRLPMVFGGVNEGEAIRMLRHAIDSGVNYLDTAWGYLGGESEIVVGKALQDGYRDKTWVATKMPIWKVERHEQLDEIFNRQLEKLQVEKIDCYMLHGLNAAGWERARDFDAVEWAEQKKDAGQIGFFGFSFHDSTEVLMQIVDGHGKWDFCQIQYNYMDVENQAGAKGLKYAAQKGLAVIVMEPLLGGKLATAPAPPVQALWDSSAVKRTPADWGLQWVWNQPEVSLVLSGMSTFEQVEQNLTSADASGVGTLGEADLALVEQVRSAYEGLVPIPCTSCKYCLPCPQGVEIPGIFGLYNTGSTYGVMDDSRRRYGRFDKSKRADQCVECGKCEEVCPQGIAVMEWLKKSHAALETDC